DRQNEPNKRWKITDEDWRNRAKWPQYEEAVNDMLQKTNTAYAPWTVIEANNKQYARLKVLETVIATIEKAFDEK
ncbi:MAG: phosphate--AMP phosphotransferase, partial [Eubacteriales bacterium]|nr:phosphate--AMP phosphotransferase [Eubacteriales bacterium]